MTIRVRCMFILTGDAGICRSHFAGGRIYAILRDALFTTNRKYCVAAGVIDCPTAKLN